MQAPDNFSYVIPVDYLLHEREKPFCWDETCDCHEDPELIAEVYAFVQHGLMTAHEATVCIAGKTI